MWVKLANEYLNLDQVVRIRFTKAFRSGHEEWAAEVETLIKGELQIFTRYRGAEALALQTLLAPQAMRSVGAPAVQVLEGVLAHPSQALANTLHDIKLP